MNKIRVVTNIAGLNNPFSDELEVDQIESNQDLIRRALRSDGRSAILVSLPTKGVALSCALVKLYKPGCQLVYYDINISIPMGRWERFKRSIYLSLIRRADLILTLQANVSEYADLMRLPQSRLKFIGFKSNAWEDTAAVARGKATEDSGSYVVACGRSYRDFATFAVAMSRNGLPGRIVFPPGGGSEVVFEGSIPPEEPLPPNLEVVVHDGTRESWVDLLLGAKIVVVPLREDVHQPAGVSVYLEAMNLSRPVVVSEGPSTHMMLDEEVAGVVPPGDAAALSNEILKLWNDASLRKKRIACARGYVAQLGGVERISRDMLTAVLTLFTSNCKSDERV